MAATTNAALRVRYLAPAEITPAPRNARTHSPAQVQQIAGQQATLEADSRSFADVATERTVPAIECV